jgi:aconitate hydratase
VPRWAFFPVDEETCEYLKATGRSPIDQVDLVRAYYKAQGMFGMPQAGRVRLQRVFDLDLGSIVPSVAGPKRPQDRIELPNLKDPVYRADAQAGSEGGYGKTEDELWTKLSRQNGC